MKNMGVYSLTDIAEVIDPNDTTVQRKAGRVGVYNSLFFGNYHEVVLVNRSVIKRRSNYFKKNFECNTMEYPRYIDFLDRIDKEISAGRLPKEFIIQSDL